MSYVNQNPIQFYDNTTKASKRGKFALAAGILVPVALAGGLLMPVPYVVYSPGPTVNVLQRDKDGPLIEIHDDEHEVSDETSGELRMVTVSVKGDPEHWVTGYEFLEAKLRSDYELRPMDEVFPDDLTAEELDEYNKKLMVSSQSTAAAAAYHDLGLPVPAEITLLGGVSGGPLEDKISEGDQLKAIRYGDTRIEIKEAADIFALTRYVPEDTEITLEIVRDGKPMEVQSKTYRPEQLTKFDDGSRLGVYLDVKPQLPHEVDIHLERIGGPSAGLVFALGIIDKYAGGKLLENLKVAGTGAITYDGVVEPIGGVVQKMYGAKRDGAEYFLTPVQNCDETMGNEPSDLKVIPVHTLSQAQEVLEKLREGKYATIPKCNDYWSDSEE